MSSVHAALKKVPFISDKTVIFNRFERSSVFLNEEWWRGAIDGKAMFSNPFYTTMLFKFDLEAVDVNVSHTRRNPPCERIRHEVAKIRLGSSITFIVIKQLSKQEYSELDENHFS